MDVQTWVLLVLNALLATFKLSVLSMFSTLLIQGEAAKSASTNAATGFLMFVFATSMIFSGYATYMIWVRSENFARFYFGYLVLTLVVELALEAIVYILFVFDFPGPQNILQRNTIFMVFVTEISELGVLVLGNLSWIFDSSPLASHFSWAVQSLAFGRRCDNGHAQRRPFGSPGSTPRRPACLGRAPSCRPIRRTTVAPLCIDHPGVFRGARRLPRSHLCRCQSTRRTTSRTNNNSSRRPH